MAAASARRRKALFVEQKVLGYEFRDAALLKRVLTHRSASSEHNERLEFLGDAVLELLVTELLYCGYPRASEGEMTRARARLVNNQRLTELARGHGVEEFLHLGHGEKMKGKAPDSILAGVLEALLGAIYLEAGLDACRQALRLLYGDELPTGEEELVRALPGESTGNQVSGKTAKSLLQERLQAASMPLPEYRLLETRGAGPTTRHVVICEARLGEQSWEERGVGQSRREAEQAAAVRVLCAMGVPSAAVPPVAPGIPERASMQPLAGTGAAPPRAARRKKAGKKAGKKGLPAAGKTTAPRGAAWEQPRHGAL